MLLTAAALPDGRCRDVRIDAGTITAVGETLTPQAGETVLDVDGYTMFPGAIDVHVHFREPGFEHKETWASGSRAAAAGGVTTVVDQPNTAPPTTDGAAFDTKAACATDSLVDYGINGGVTDDWDPESLFDRPLFALGEVFMADSTGDMGIDAETFDSALATASRASVPVTVHAEDDTEFQPAALDEASGRGRDAAVDCWSRYRPAAAEITAVKRALSVADQHDVPVHIAHTSTPEAIDAVAATTSTCEVTPHHAFLSRADADALGTFGRMNPPLRSESRRQAVFERIVDGTVDIIATDHAPHTHSEKDNPLSEAPSGVPGVETMVPLLLGAVAEGTLSPTRVQDLVATTPAERFDCPSKGRIAPGYDADLFIVDLDRQQSITADQLYTACGWTPFEGLPGVFPVATLVRGQFVYADPAADIAAPIDGPFGPSIGQNVRR